MPWKFPWKTFHSVKARLTGVLPVKLLADEQPLRAELFSIDQLEAYAKKLAAKHDVNFKKVREVLLTRLKENENLLMRANEQLNEAAKAKRNISPAGEWLLDNYYLIEEQIRLAQKYLPKGYSRGLPNLSRGPLSGYPRIYDIAMEIVSHGDGRLDTNRLIGFVTAYQSVTHLTLGELWGIPIMIRLALIENLRRVCVRMMKAQNDSDLADLWANRILDVSAKDTNDVVHETASMAKANLPMSDSFVAEFTRRLHGISASLNLPLIWLEKKLSEQGETIDRLIQSVSQTQATNQVSIANTIESLRVLEGTDWHVFVEGLSVVENILKHDPSGQYAGMSFDTRDSYRHAVEKLSLKSRLAQEEVATRALYAAQAAAVLSGTGHRSAHIGYYLIDEGLGRFSRVLGTKLSLKDYLTAKNTSLSFPLYAGSIIAITLLATGLAMYIARLGGWQSWKLFAVSAVPVLLIASQTALSLVNWISTLLVKPVNLPRMDFSESIPGSARTLVAVPTMLGSAASIDSLIENIEVSYLANAGANTFFALLTDFRDAQSEEMQGDDELVRRASAGVEKLNHKYRSRGGDIFFLFHRKRKWNEKEKCWMGRERKRGKLSDLNALLRGNVEGRFSVITGDITRLQNVKYVITLDTDTRMPRNAVIDLASIISHPLNRPQFDKQKKRVTAGYGILQPRVEAAYPGENPSLFVKIYGGETGIDPYTKAVSDVYQDLFFEGSFIGKGLYDIDAFESSLNSKLPENLILSHDMLEGCYARCALVTDVQFHEEYPTGYLKDMSRRRRWIRGDWQIAGWLFSKVPDSHGKKTLNPLSALSKWKIADNLRRSLVNPAAVFLFVMGWLTFPVAWSWTAMVVVFAGLPMLTRSLAEVVRKPEGISMPAHLSSVLSLFAANNVQFVLSLAFIVYEAYVSLSAIAVTLWRLLISRKHLLEWSASGETRISRDMSIFGHYMAMVASPIAVILCLASGRTGYDMPALILMAAWLCGPALARFISVPSAASRAELSAGQERFLRRTARRTWDFFEAFVTARDNWLPPDNFQEQPLNAVAHRTSPTNIGLSLLSNLSAFDFGYVSAGMLLKRTRDTLDTMNNMAKFKGHFYNWYDTRSLKPLEPQYISSVDSGNLAGHLLVLKSGLAELHSIKIISPKLFDGIRDTLDVMSEHITQAGMDAGRRTRDVMGLLFEPPKKLSAILAILRKFSAEMRSVAQGLTGLERPKKWADLLEKQVGDFIHDITYMAPWLELGNEIPGYSGSYDEKMIVMVRALNEELLTLDAIPAIKNTWQNWNKG